MHTLHPKDRFIALNHSFLHVPILSHLKPKINSMVGMKPLDSYVHQSAICWLIKPCKWLRKVGTWFWCFYTSHWSGFLMTNATTYLRRGKRILLYGWKQCLQCTGEQPRVTWSLRKMGLDPAKSSAWKFFKEFSLQSCMAWPYIK